MAVRRTASACGCGAPAWPLEDDDLRRRAQGDWHDSADGPFDGPMDVRRSSLP